MNVEPGSVLGRILTRMKELMAEGYDMETAGEMAARELTPRDEQMNHPKTDDDQSL